MYGVPLATRVLISDKRTEVIEAFKIEDKNKWNNVKIGDRKSFSSVNIGERLRIMKKGLDR